MPAAVVRPTWQAMESDLPTTTSTGPAADVPTEVHLRGAVNETVAFQLILRGTQPVHHGLMVAVDELVSATGRIPPREFRVYRRWPITIERYPNWYLRSTGPQAPREIHDVLVPLTAPVHGQPFTLSAGQSLGLWIEIRIPFVAEPGTYSGSLLVQDAQGSSQTWHIVLEVQDLFLAPQDAIPVLADVQLKPLIAAHTRLDPENLRLVLDDPAARLSLVRAFQILQRHGLSPHAREVFPLLRQDLDGAVYLDWHSFDAFCGPLIDGSAYEDRRPPARWPIPVDAANPSPIAHGGRGSASYESFLRAYLTEAGKHVCASGWQQRAFVDLRWDDHSDAGPDALALVRRLATLSREAMPDVSIASRLAPQSMAPFGWFGHHYEDLTDLIAVSAAPARYQNGPALERLHAEKKETWLPPDRPPYSASLSVEAPPVHARSLPWQAFLQGHSAILLDKTTDWPPGVMAPPLSNRGAATDAWLLYPGRPFGLDEPIPSVRLKQLQQGIQDYQRLRTLAEHGRAETARLIAGSLIKAAGLAACGDNYQDGLFDRRIEDPDLWALARSILDAELDSAVVEDPAAPDVRGADRADWARFLAATREIAVLPESARLQPDLRPGQKGYLLSYEVAIRSELRTPLEGRLRFGPLAPRIRSVSDIVRVGPIEEMGLVRKKLIAAMPELPPTDLDGHFIQALVMDAGATGYVEVNATTSIVSVRRTPLPITIDGRLDDWTPQEFNAAGDFRLIAEYHGYGEGRPRALAQTIAYFTHDDEMLYVGIHAAAPQSPGPSPPGPALGGSWNPSPAAGSPGSSLSTPGAAGGSPSAGSPDAMQPVAPFRNYVRYEDLMPLGEDLVEILIDPTGAGTMSGDFYHIVVKSNGNPVFERGVRMTPPIGDVQPWPGLVPRCEVAPTADGWSAEIALPISAFGEDARANPVWGINLARLEPVRGEYSDWARAPRYCYDPRTLGNLVWR